MTGSWLSLERYALGECDPEETRRIEAMLVDDSDARTILGAIRADRRVLRPLPVRDRRRRFLAVGAALLMAAAALLIVIPREDGRVKGGALSLELVGLKDGLATSVSRVTVGDRLGLRLTCPPGRTEIDVVVFHGGEVAFPIAPASVDCGNRVAIPGAFSVDGPGDVVACVAVGDPPARAVLGTGPAAADACVEARADW